jgi:multidrug efflux pump subunit AcrB
VASLVLLLLTPFVLLRTPRDIFPSINIPVVSIVWSYAGLEAQEIEQRFNYNQERALTTTVNDIEPTESNAYNGVGVIKAFFREGTSVDAGIAQVTAISQTLIRSMPPGTTPPLIIRYSASTVPVLQYSISSPQRSEPPWRQTRCGRGFGPRPRRRLVTNHPGAWMLSGVTVSGGGTVQWINR